MRVAVATIALCLLLAVPSHARDDARKAIDAVLQEMDLTSKVAPPSRGAVHCLTVHGSKGL